MCVCLFIDRLVWLPPEIAQRVWSKNRRRCHVCGRLDLVHSKVNINKADKNAQSNDWMVLCVLFYLSFPTYIGARSKKYIRR